MGRVIEILALQALIFQGQRNLERALAVLGRALNLAGREGFVRVFLDEGEPLVKLLYQAKTHQVGGDYAHALLSVCNQVPGPRLDPVQLLVEPLTSREIEVLNLIADGLSNPAIADRLVISLPTVKRHISNIYAKLGVESRVQAVSAGRELKILQ
jgi:LuxR family maltose regulon positive regulatory protein